MLLPDPITPAIEAVLQIAPCAAFSAGTAACAQRKGPIRLVVKILDQKSSVSASRSENGIGVGVAGVPALLTRKSSRPRLSIALITIRSASAGRDTSPGAATIRRPSALSRSTASGPRESSGKWLSATVAPQSEKISAAASPIPEAAPVTSTALPAKSALIMSRLGSDQTPRAAGPTPLGCKAPHFLSWEGALPKAFAILTLLLLSVRPAPPGAAGWQGGLAPPGAPAGA